MGRFGKWIVAASLLSVITPGTVFAQGSAAGPVKTAAEKFAADISWRGSTFLEADFDCTGKVQYAMLGSSDKEIVVAIFTHGLSQAPALLRFDAEARNILATKIRLDDYSLSAEEIAGVSGSTPPGYRPSTRCHGVRLSDDSSEAAHIYWDHDHQRFDSWTQ